MGCVVVVYPFMSLATPEIEAVEYRREVKNMFLVEML